MNEKISLEILLSLCDDEVAALVSRIQGIGLDKGIDIAEDWLRKKVVDAVEDIHVDKFTVNKYSRKFRKWWKGLF